MKIGIQTWGSDGDIRPFIALANGLCDAGHSVTLALSSVQGKTYPEFIRPGLSIVPVGVVTPEMKAQLDSFDSLWQQRNPLKQLETLLQLAFDPWLELLLQAAQQLVAEQDVVIGHFLLYPLFAVAQQQNRPWVSVMLQPGLVPSRHIPPEGLISLGQYGNSLLWKAADRLLTHAFKSRVNRLRQLLKLPPITGLLQYWRDTPRLNLLAYSAALRPAPPDWPATQQVCGCFTLTATHEPWEMPDSLRHFLEQGPPPVYLGFGSMIAAEPCLDSVAAITRLLLAAVQQVGCRAIVQSRWDELPELAATLPQTVYPVVSLPHRDVFPHCAAVVHHGGAGTTHSAALAGCPMVIVAHATDQIFWARMLYRRGVSSRPLQRSTLTATQLASALQKVLTTPAMRQRAQQLSILMQQENGVATAIHRIEALQQD